MRLSPFLHPPELGSDLTRQHFRRSEDTDCRESREIRLIKAEHLGHAVALHGGDQSRIVGILALDVVSNNQVALIGEHATFVEKQAKYYCPL